MRRFDQNEIHTVAYIMETFLKRERLKFHRANSQRSVYFNIFIKSRMFRIRISDHNQMTNNIMKEADFDIQSMTHVGNVQKRIMSLAKS